MLRALRETFSLLLPALVPSWRFFKTIQPAPQIEWQHRTPSTWTPLTTRPDTLSPVTMLRRVFWNPRWNDDLFMVSCAERLMGCDTRHSRDEILARIAQKCAGDLGTRNMGAGDVSAQNMDAGDVRFRLIFADRVAGIIEHHEVWRSDFVKLAPPGATAPPPPTTTTTTTT